MNELTLSKNKIHSFAGDVVTLGISGKDDLSAVVWTVSDPEIIRLRTFDRFHDGILVTLLREGSSIISATLGEETVTCAVSVRAARQADPNGSFQYYIGDFHAHTSRNHRKAEFWVREGESAEITARAIRDEGIFDFCTVSDHECLVDGKELFSVYKAAEDVSNERFIVMPAVENEVDIDKIDRYNLPTRNSGEVVTFNGAGVCGAKSWEEFYRRILPGPCTVASFAHPQALGCSLRALWSFRLQDQTRPHMREVFHMMEMGQGMYPDGVFLRTWNLLNERTYSVALDCGYTISPNCSSDCHGPRCVNGKPGLDWGAKSMAGRTIVLAPELSKEMLFDALLHARTYACESGNVKLFYTVNGKQSSNTLELTDEYKFNIHFEPFKKPGAHIKYVEIVSDYGFTIWSSDTDADTADLEFTVHSDSARYFFIRMFDEHGARTWSAPVWTGRAFDECPRPEFTGEPIETNDWEIHADCGENPELLINGDPMKAWSAGERSNAQITIDMKKTERIAGFGYYHHDVPRGEQDGYAHLLSDYEYSVSADGVNFQKVCKGIVRDFGGEHIIRIDPVEARYVRLNVLNTVGSVARMPALTKTGLIIGELAVFRAKD